MLALDHVILGTPDLDATAARLEREHRLPSVAGGRHTGFGTENRIVPLGEAYLELMGIADAQEAQGNPFGQWVAGTVEGGEAWLGWCVRTDDLDGLCDRLGLTPVPMSRARPDGTELRWRLAALERAMSGDGLPFFIQWEAPDEELPGRAGGAPQAAGSRLAALEVGGDEDELARWLGERLGEVRVVEGPPGVRAVAVAGDGGTEVVRPEGAR